MFLLFPFNILRLARQKVNNFFEFSKAADALYISQSVLTKHIQELEKELGVPLLNRTTHAATLTDAGRILAA